MKPNIYLESAAEKIEPSLKALQTHYQEIIEKYQPVVDHAQAQLTYINGVLSGFAAIPNNSAIPTNSAIPVNSAIATNSAILTNSATNSIPVKSLEKTPRIVRAARKAPKTSSKSPQFAPNYVGDTLSGAIEKILNDRRGQEVGIEEVVRALYENLDSEKYKIAKDRVTKNLSKGKGTGLWERISDKSGFYTAKA